MVGIQQKEDLAWTKGTEQ